MCHARLPTCLPLETAHSTSRFMAVSQLNVSGKLASTAEGISPVHLRPVRNYRSPGHVRLTFRKGKTTVKRTYGTRTLRPCILRGHADRFAFETSESSFSCPYGYYKLTAVAGRRERLGNRRDHARAIISFCCPIAKGFTPVSGKKSNSVLDKRVYCGRLRRLIQYKTGTRV